MKKSILILAIVALFGAYAEPVTPEMAKSVANAWAVRNAQFKSGTSAKSVAAECDPDDSSVVLWYQVSMFGGGCLMVAPDTEIEPIVAALDNDPGVLPAAHPLRGILTLDMRRRLAFLAKGKKKAGPSLMGAAPVPEDDDAVAAREWGAQQKAKWAKLGVGLDASLMASEQEGVEDIAVKINVVKGFEKDGPLTHWNQENGVGANASTALYNASTPEHCVCGCVATALSAILQFFKVAKSPDDPWSPAEIAHTVEGVSFEKWSANGMSAATIASPEGDTTYDWSILPADMGGEGEGSKTTALTKAQIELIGRVAYNAGVSVNMEWKSGESSAYEMEIANALRECYGFKDARYVRGLDPSHYRKLIYAQCWAGKPVAMGITGHSVVAVGYGKDAEGVDRVRVFLGWGGAGDAWYALPYVDTASVLGGASSVRLVDDIVTMLDYNPEDPETALGSIPVYGQLIPAIETEVTVDGISIMSNGEGFFGVCVPTSANDRQVVIEVPLQGKSDSVRIKADAQCSSNVYNLESGGTRECRYVYLPGALTTESTDGYACIPRDVLIPLLNSETAVSFAEAKGKALRAGKPILAISGKFTEETAAAAWNIIHDLDKNNVDDFTNRFVVLCLTYDPTDKISDGNPSVALFNPADYTTGDLWSPENGRLAYWSVYDRQYTTNETLYAELYNPTNASANRYISLEDITEGVYSVLDALDQHKLALAAITIESTTSEPGTEDSSYCYVRRNLQLPASACNPIEAPSVITNGATIWECAGWTALMNGVEYDGGTTASATFAVEASNTYTVVWHWTPTAYRVTVTTAYEKENGQTWDFGVQSVVEALAAFDGWYAPGDVISISAPAVIRAYRQYAFANWRANNQMITKWVTWDVAKGAKAVVSGPSLTFTVGGAPVTIQASYDYLPSADLPGSGKYLLAVSSEGNDGFTAPDTLWGTNVLAAVNDLGKMPNLVVRLASASTNVNGAVWKCTQYVYNGVTNDAVKGATSALALTNGTNSLVWLWASSAVPPPPSSFIIDWDVALSNLSSSDFSTNVLTLADLEASGKTLEDIANATTVPKGWKPVVSADGQNVVVKLELDEEALADSMSGVKVYIASNEDEPGMLTVSADVPDGIRGFWYSIFGADELTGPWSVVAEGAYEKDVSETEPSVQVQSEADKSTDKVTLSIAIDPTKTKQFYKVKVTEKRPTAE